MYNFKNTLALLILLTLITGSCKKISNKDLSLTVKEYQALGMPDPDKIWATQDYLKAHGTLSNLRMKDPLAFPRKHSRKSGSVFRRIINKENLTYINDTTFSLRDRALEIMNFSSLLNNLSYMYTDNIKSEQNYKEELIDIDIFELYVREKMLDLAGQIMNSKKQSDIIMQSGTGSVISGYVVLISIILGDQVKSNVYSSRDLDRLSKEVSRSIKDYLHWLGPAEKQKIGSSIRNTIDKTTSDSIKDVYRKTLKLLEDSNQ